MATTPAQPQGPIPSPSSRPDGSPGAGSDALAAAPRPWTRLAFAVTSAAAFAGAAPLVVRANEYAWDLEARFVLGPEEDQSLYGIAFILYAAILALPALAHLVSVAVHAFGTAFPGRAGQAGGEPGAMAWVVHGVGVLGYAAVCALGVAMCLGLGAAPGNLQARAVVANLAPLGLVAAPAVLGLAPVHAAGPEPLVDRCGPPIAPPAAGCGAGWSGLAGWGGEGLGAVVVAAEEEAVG